MKKRAVASVLIAISIICLQAFPVLAIAAPSSVSITDERAFQNVLVTGDILFTAEYAINYGTVPTVSVADTFIFQLLDTDGITELGRVLAFPYVTGGYGKGVISFYFAVKPGTAQYTIRIMGNPTYFATPYSQDFVMPASTYTTTSSNVSTDIYNVVMAYATDLDPTYILDLLQSLKDSIGGAATTLSGGVGEIYFTTAIPNLKNMSPPLFDIQEYAPVKTTDTYTTVQADAYKNRFVGTWVGNSTAAAGNLLGTAMQVAMGVFIMIICILWAVASVALTGQAQASFLPMASTLLGGVLLGWVSMAVMSVIVFLCALYVGAIIIFRIVQA